MAEIGRNSSSPQPIPEVKNDKGSLLFLTIEKNFLIFTLAPLFPTTGGRPLQPKILVPLLIPSAGYVPGRDAACSLSKNYVMEVSPHSNLMLSKCHPLIFNFKTSKQTEHSLSIDGSFYFRYFPIQM